jgi:hypothetical protein
VSNSIVVVVVVFVGVNGAVVLQPRIFNVVEQLFSYSSIAVVIGHADDDNDGVE